MYQNAAIATAENDVDKALKSGTVTISASETKYITGDNAGNIGVIQYIMSLYLDAASNTSDLFDPMFLLLALVSVGALAVLVLNKKKF